jgi:ribonuclease HII
MANRDTHQKKLDLPEEVPLGVLIECGVDEVGIASAIAEVYAAACILDPSWRINGVRGSKVLTADRRKQMVKVVKAPPA